MSRLLQGCIYTHCLCSGKAPAFYSPDLLSVVTGRSPVTSSLLAPRLLNPGLISHFLTNNIGHDPLAFLRNTFLYVLRIPSLLDPQSHGWASLLAPLLCLPPFFSLTLSHFSQWLISIPFVPIVLSVPTALS
jgi:hypothetical protein